MTVDRMLHVLVVDDDDADTLMIEEVLVTMQAPPVLHRVRDGHEADVAADIAASYGSHANAFVTKPLDPTGSRRAVQEINRLYRDVAVLPRR